ncbi:phosphate ABC transporter, periplasmic phosphate-binding protein [Roseobacter sp. GAI101]|nr:phosphate ABC transporter, periplasmic phosphate-binding protein [Roseobacter sp. GAI101]
MGVIRNSKLTGDIMSLVKLTTSALAISAVCATAAVARDQVQVAGSSTVLPYASIVAEAFGENFDFPTPVVESGGSSAGLKRFCEGVGENTIDIANASRKIKSSEQEVCASNGVTDIIEVQIGYDGIVFASDIDGNTFEFTPEDWYKALSAEVVVDGAIVANPYKNWSEVNASFPDQPIQAYIPGTKHGTREVFEEKVILAGCEATGDFEAFKAANGDDKKAAEKACIALRTDGASVDIDGDYTETLARIESNKDGIGVFGLAFYENNTDKLSVATMSGVEPTVETISTGDYPVSRPLFFYVKKAHIGVIPGLKEFAEFFVADEIAGPDGPLAEYGLVSDPELATVQDTVANETVLGNGS